MVRNRKQNRQRSLGMLTYNLNKEREKGIPISDVKKAEFNRLNHLLGLQDRIP